MKRLFAVVIAVAACGKARTPEFPEEPDDAGIKVHTAGVLDPTSPYFHGKLVEQAGWRFTTCTKCHGADLAGGLAKVACATCHVGGPQTCTTCHGQPPMSGSHAPHKIAGVACTECHVVPATYDAPGHPGHGVTFGSLASTSATPHWDPATKTCGGVYCHGDAFIDSAAKLTKPMWGGGAGQAACGDCHGLPPSSHQTSAPCVTCHFRTVDASGAIASKALHVNGKFDVGDGAGTCTSCHGNATVPLSGAHVSHITGAHRLRGPMTCSECHVMPAAVDSAGHIDSGPPAEISFGALAMADGAMPAYAAASKTCSGVSCHGGEMHMADDQSPNLLRAPVWNGPRDQAACGTCHGAPPIDDEHPAGTTLADCATCHRATTDPSGNIIVGADGASTHMNGRIDVALPR